MDRGLGRGGLLLGAERPGLPLRIPGGQKFGVVQTTEEISDFRIGPRVSDKRGVINVPGLLSPWIEDDFIPCVIWMKGADNATCGIVKEDRTHSDADLELKPMRVGEEWFKLANWLAFVIEHRPAASDPAWRHILLCEFRFSIDNNDASGSRVSPGRRSRLGLDFLLDFTTEAIRV